MVPPRGQLPRADYVRRDRLLTALLAGQIGIVEAGAGYGKSVLASQLRQALGVATVYVPLGPADDNPTDLIASLRRAVANARLSDVLSATDIAEPAVWVERFIDALGKVEDQVLVILDDAHHVQSREAAALVARIAVELPERHRLLIVARRLTGALTQLGSAVDAVRLTTRTLAFTAGEAGELMQSWLGERPAELEVRVLVEATQGWASAIVVAAARWRSGGSGRAAAASSAPELISTPVREILEILEPSDRRALIELAHVPFISPELCASVPGGEDGTFARFVAAGVPLARTESGWWELPSPVGQYLVSLQPAAPATLLAAASEYSRHGDALMAIRVLLEGGQAEQAAAALERMRPDRVEELGLPLLGNMVESLPEAALRAHPGVLLHVARVAEGAHQMDARAAALDRASRFVDSERADPAAVRELEAERARDLMWDERTRVESASLARSVLERAGEEELVAKARVLDVLGRLASWFSSAGPQPEAESLLEGSARLARRVGQRTWAAQALIPLAIGVHFGLCRYDRALAVLDDALSDLPARNRYRAMVQTFRAEVLIEVGRFADAESAITEIRDIGISSREQWMLAYAAWNEANMASYQGDADRTIRTAQEVERHRDVWYEQASGVEWLAQATDYLDRAGAHELARDYLHRARERMAGTERPVRVYGAAVAGRSGDPIEGERAIVQALAGPAVEPQERWPLLLMRAYAAMRRAAPEAGELAAEAFETCAELGHPDGPLIRERAVAQALLPLAARAGSPAAAALLEREGKLTIRLLGGFEALRAGRAIELPPGRPAKAVRSVAAAGGRLHVEELIERLWPGSDPAAGRNRLRNLLSRVRAAGDLLERDDEVIALAGGAEIDAELFEQQARAAQAAVSSGDARSAEVLARSALERYRGELLPEDRYEPWAAAARERLQLRYLELLDLLAAAADRRSEVDEAARLIQRAIDAEPYDEERYLRLARLLGSQGRVGSALAVLRRARAALAGLALDPSEALEDLEATLKGSRLTLTAPG